MSQCGAPGSSALATIRVISEVVVSQGVESRPLSGCEPPAPGHRTRMGRALQDRAAPSAGRCLGSRPSAGAPNRSRPRHASRRKRPAARLERTAHMSERLCRIIEEHHSEAREQDANAPAGSSALPASATRNRTGVSCGASARALPISGSDISTPSTWPPRRRGRPEPDS